MFETRDITVSFVCDGSRGSAVQGGSNVSVCEEKTNVPVTNQNRFSEPGNSSVWMTPSEWSSRIIEHISSIFLVCR